MQVRFSSVRLHKLLSDEKSMTKKYGKDASRSVTIRLAHLVAVSNVADLLQMPGDWHHLRGNRSGQLAAKISKSLRLIIMPTRTPPTTAGGTIDWKRVDDITLLEVVDYH